MFYGYARVSTTKQSIERQIRNIREFEPEALIVSEAFTGTTIDRPMFNKLLKGLKSGDTVIFDSVSRMARNSDEGFELYQKLYGMGIELIFLNERHIDTAVYREAVQGKVEMTGTEVDCILEGINKYLWVLAKRQIQIAFDQAQKEVDDLRKRTIQGMMTAKLNGKQIGAKAGTKRETPKGKLIDASIRKYSRDFDGTLGDAEVMVLAGCSRKTYYQHKSALKAVQA